MPLQCQRGPDLGGPEGGSEYSMDPLRTIKAEIDVIIIIIILLCGYYNVVCTHIHMYTCTFKVNRA